MNLIISQRKTARNSSCLFSLILTHRKYSDIYIIKEVYDVLKQRNNNSTIHYADGCPGTCVFVEKPQSTPGFYTSTNTDRNLVLGREYII